MEEKSYDIDQRAACMLTAFCDECESTFTEAVHCSDCEMDYCMSCDSRFHSNFPSHTRAPVRPNAEAMRAAEQCSRDLRAQDEANRSEIAMFNELHRQAEMEEELAERSERMIEGQEGIPEEPEDMSDEDMKRLH